MTDTRKPALTIRDGSMKATIWKNQTDDGKTYFTTQLVNAYKDREGVWKDSDRYSGTELLQLARLAAEAYTAIASMRS